MDDEQLQEQLPCQACGYYEDAVAIHYPDCPDNDIDIDMVNTIPRGSGNIEYPVDDDNTLRCECGNACNYKLGLHRVIKTNRIICSDCLEDYGIELITLEKIVLELERSQRLVGMQQEALDEIIETGGLQVDDRISDIEEQLYDLNDFIALDPEFFEEFHERHSAYLESNKGSE